MNAPVVALLGVLLAAITLALLLPVPQRRPRHQADTLDGMLAVRALDAYLRQELSAAAYADLPGPKPPLAVDRLSELPERQARKSSEGRAGEDPVHRWARIFRIEEEARRFKSAVSAFCDARDAARHDARMAGIAARAAEPFPHLDRQWEDDTGSFRALVDVAEQQPWFTGTGSFAATGMA